MAVFFELCYEGEAAESSILDFYDASQALVGFQRSLAITTHAVLNDEVITQAPSLKGARIIALPPERGSWKMTAAIAIGAGHLILQVNAIPKETPLGNIIYSAYDYVISESLGFHVDYKETLGEQADRLRGQSEADHIPEQSRLDSVVEKCHTAIRDMHRPIVKSKTALTGAIRPAFYPYENLFSDNLDEHSYEYINYTEEGDVPELISGKVSSYNINTLSGRIYDAEERRTISFLLSPHLRNNRSSLVFINSLAGNINDDLDGVLTLTVLRNRSRSGRTKSYYVIGLGI